MSHLLSLRILFLTVSILLILLPTCTATSKKHLHQTEAVELLEKQQQQQQAYIEKLESRLTTLSTNFQRLQSLLESTLKIHIDNDTEADITTTAKSSSSTHTKTITPTKSNFPICHGQLVDDCSQLDDCLLGYRFVSGRPHQCGPGLSTLSDCTTAIPCRIDE